MTSPVTAPTPGSARRAADPPIAIGLMCKPPRAGTSKTRLARGIGEAAAAALAAAFLQDTARTVLCIAGQHGLRPHALYRPAGAARELGRLLGPNWPLLPCEADDLGQAMLAGLTDLLADCPAGAILIGSDLPTLPATHIGRAVKALRAGCQRTVAIGPSADGGYHLIGAKDAALVAPLFRTMAWSTEVVFAETRRRSHASGLKLVETGTWFDIDLEADLERLAESLAAQPDAAPATRTALAQLT